MLFLVCYGLAHKIGEDFPKPRIPYERAFEDCNSSNIYENLTNKFFTLDFDQYICLRGNFMLVSDNIYHINSSFPTLSKIDSNPEWRFEYINDINALLILSKIQTDTLKQANEFLEYPLTRLSCKALLGRCTIQAFSLPNSYVLRAQSIGHKVVVSTIVEGVTDLDMMRNCNPAAQYNTTGIFLSKFNRKFIFSRDKNDAFISFPINTDSKFMADVLGESNNLFLDAYPGVPTCDYSSKVRIIYSKVNETGSELPWFLPSFQITLPSEGGVYRLDAILDKKFPIEFKERPPNVHYEGDYTLLASLYSVLVLILIITAIILSICACRQRRKEIAEKKNNNSNNTAPASV